MLPERAYTVDWIRVEGILTALDKAAARVNLFNLGTDEYCEVNDSIAWIAEHLGVRPEVRYAGGARGWVGDSPFVFLDCSRIRALGWKPRLTVREGVIRPLEFFDANPWVLAEGTP